MFKTICTPNELAFLSNVKPDVDGTGSRVIHNEIRVKVTVTPRKWAYWARQLLYRLRFIVLRTRNLEQPLAVHRLVSHSLQQIIQPGRSSRNWRTALDH